MSDPIREASLEQLVKELLQEVTDSDDYFLKVDSVVSLVNRARAALAAAPPEMPEPTHEQIAKKPEPRATRKAVQLALCQDYTMAVADDGSIWIWSDSLHGWRDFPPLPDREEVE